MNATAKIDDTPKRAGRLFIVSAPSGAGKTTLCRAVREHFPDMRYSVSYTTRAPRAGETDGVDYFFIETADFERKIEQGAWAEWAKVHGHYYGTAHRFLQEAMAAGRDLLLDIDVQGTLQMIAHYPDSITIFIMPPSVEALKTRLEKRGTDSPAVIAKRLANARAEMEKKHLYRYVIVNDQLPAAIERLLFIIRTCRAGAGSGPSS